MININNTQFIADPDSYGIITNINKYILADESVLRTENYKYLNGNFNVAKPTYITEEYSNTQIYIRGLSKRFIEANYASLNKFNGVSFSASQWKIILGQWLDGFLFDIYDCYNKINQFRSSQPFMLRDSNATFDASKDHKTFGFLENNSTKFRGTLYCDIFSLLGMKVINRKYSYKENMLKWIIKKEHRIKLLTAQCLDNPFSVIKKIKNRLIPKKKVKYEVKDFYGDVLVVQSRMPEDDERYIAAQSNNRIQFIRDLFFWDKQYQAISNIKSDIELRKNILNDTYTNNEFEKISYELIVKYMPISFFEGLKILKNTAVEIVSKWNYRKIYHSAHYSELFLLCCVLQKEKEGCILCDIQHSALYGDVFFMGYNEYTIWDRFLTWGWSNDATPFECDIYPIGITRYPKKKETYSNLKKKPKILMAVNSPELNEGGRGFSYHRYTDHQMEFIDSLSNNDRHKLVIRTPSNRYISDLQNRCEKKYPYIKFESVYNKSFAESLAESELLVCDYYGSPHIEALILGFPFVMFEGFDIIKHNDSIKHFFLEMNKLGVYYKSGRDLAIEISKHESYYEWLNNSKITKLFEEYLNALTNYDKDLRSLWLSEFLGN